ncbi:MAG: hypothetical protein JWP81_3857 [Ferruginibacter sp.]|nr:hypothetical protein [Ferruginibacter sp.]
MESADEINLPGDPEFRSAFVAYIEWGTRIAVLNSNETDLSMNPLEPIPEWGWGVLANPFSRDAMHCVSTYIKKRYIMKNLLYTLLLTLAIALPACNSPKQSGNENASQHFADFEHEFLDAYWKQYPSASIYAGYGKYYDQLVIPDSTAFANSIAFSKNWIDSLNKLDFQQLSDNNKISFNIIKNQLESDIWYRSVFRQQQWDASAYNISGECDYLINQPYAPLDERLKTLSRHLQNADTFYKAALITLRQPTREHLELAIVQNQGGLSVFGSSLTDSIRASHLTDGEKDSLAKNVVKTVAAMNGYIAALKNIAANKNTQFRNFRIGKDLFTEKFKYDLATDLTPEQVYEKAMKDKQRYQHNMVLIADSVWAKYYPTQSKPTDSLQMVQLIMDKIQLQHATPANFFDSLTSQVYLLKKFIIEKNLFDFDTTTPPIKVRIMPPYQRGFTVANAEFTPPYQKKGTTYYNIDDLTLYPPQKAESVLREYNNYSSQLLSIHEAVPGHCVQGIYNNKKSPDVVRSVFQNGAMIEGWAVYTEGMMLENGWGNHTPEMELIHAKLKLRELANVLIDYDIQCLNKPKEDILHLLVNECFQTGAQAEEKYHRATVSQVQLCSYYSGATAIQALRDDYKKKKGDQYSLKNFHETFLSFGSSPVKYIRERMLQ